MRHGDQTVYVGSPNQSVPSPNGDRSRGKTLPSPGERVAGGASSAKASPDTNGEFEIYLIHEGRTVWHEVYEAMPVVQLMREAKSFFGLEPEGVVLMLFSMVPKTLDRTRTLQGPPRVGPNATVMVFVVPGLVADRVSRATVGGEAEIFARVSSSRSKNGLEASGNFQAPEVRWGGQKLEAVGSGFCSFLGATPARTRAARGFFAGAPASRGSRLE